MYFSVCFRISKTLEGERMKKPNSIEKISTKSIDEILAFLNILKIVSNLSNFEKWLREHHHIQNVNKNIFEGYKFFLQTVVRSLIYAIELDVSLDIQEDYAFHRARFKGINVEEIPNTCEKIIFIKNIWNLTRSLRKAKDWNEFKKSAKWLEGLLKMFNKLYERATSRIKKDLALNALTKFYTFIFLNDTHRGIPQGYILPSTIKISATSEYLQKVFKGYTFTLQYLWFILLGKEKFCKSCVKALHRASEIYSKKSEEYINIEVGLLPEQKREKEIKKLSKLKEWYALDAFFGKIKDEIVEPLERELGLNLTFEPLLTIEKTDKKIFSKFLSKERLKDPEYLTKRKKKKKDIKKWLDYKLLWYEVEVLDTQKLLVFNGVPAFISILLGSVQLQQDKVFIKVFKHPVKGVNGYDYSFGILIPVFGTSGLTDYSGWLIFFDCATDYSGFGGSLFVQAKVFIDKLKEDKKIEIGEIIVDKKIFKEYLKERAVSSTFESIIRYTPFGRITELDIEEEKRKLDDFMNYVKGKFFECVVYKWINEKEEYDKVVWNHWEEEREIDILAYKDNKIYLFECKVNLHKDNIKNTITKIKRNVTAILRRNKKYEVIPILVVLNPLPSDRKRSLEKKGIRVIDNFKQEIENNRIFDKMRKSILRILSFNISDGLLFLTKT